MKETTLNPAFLTATRTRHHHNILLLLAKSLVRGYDRCLL
jgi:hypothetical protein